MNRKKLPEGLLDLVEYYSGDEAWEKFANYLPVDGESVTAIVHKFGVHPTVARALEWHIGVKYVDAWLNQDVPALDKHKPIDLLNNYENGEVCVREILMRMH